MNPDDDLTRETEPFDLSSVLGQLRNGRQELMERRTALAARRQEIDAELAQIEADIAKIDQMGITYDKVPDAEPEEQRKRSHGVLRLVERLVKEAALDAEAGLIRDGKFTIEEFAEHVHRADAAVLHGSIRSALHRLCERGMLLRTTVDGKHGYQLAPRPSEPGGILSADDVRARVLELLRSGSKTFSQLAWEFQGASLVGHEDVLNDPRIEKMDSDHGTVFCLKLPIQRELFPGADPPPAHAFKDDP